MSGQGAADYGWVRAEAYGAGMASGQTEQVRSWQVASGRMAAEAQSRAGLLSQHPGIDVGRSLDLGVAGFDTSSAASADLDTAERAAQAELGFGDAVRELEARDAAAVAAGEGEG